MSGEIYRPLIEDMRWSYSRAKSFNQCKYGWFLKYIHGTDPESKFFASYGKFMHQLFEWYYRGIFTKEELVNIYMREFSEKVSGVRPRASVVNDYILCGINCLQDLKPVPFNIVAVEEEVEFQLNGVNFTGIIDLLCEDDGELAIIDHKSKTLKPRSNRKKPTANDLTLDNMLRQLYIYSAAVKEKYGKFPKWLCFNCFRNGVFIREPFRNEKYEEAIGWITEQIEEAKNEEEFPPYIEYFFCRYLCDVSHDCIYNE